MFASRNFRFFSPAPPLRKKEGLEEVLAEARPSVAKVLSDDLLLASQGTRAHTDTHKRAHTQARPPTHTHSHTHTHTLTRGNVRQAEIALYRFSPANDLR